MARSIVHPRFLDRLPQFYPSRCNIQQATEARSALGSVTRTWAAVTDLQNLPCTLAPFVQQGPTGQSEVEREMMTTFGVTHHLALRGYFPDIHPTMQALVDGETYDIEAVEHDSHHQTTRLKLIKVTL